MSNRKENHQIIKEEAENNKWLNLIKVAKEIKNIALESQRGLKLDSINVNVIITGGSQGLGLEIAKLLQQKGCTVIIVDVTKSTDQVYCHSNVFYYQCDISNIFEVRKLHLKIKLKHGLISLLINNAGVTKIACLQEMTNEDIDTVMKVNLWGTYLITSTFINDLLLEKQCFIVNIASILGCISPSRLSTYCSSKGGQIMFHKCLTSFLEDINSTRGKKVGTLLVCTGKIKTKMFASVETPSHILAPDICPIELAKRIVEVVETGGKHNLRYPYYANLIGVVMKLDWHYRSIIKTISGMNNSTTV